MNKRIFSTKTNKVPVADTHNRAGGRAYSLSDKAALVQHAVTGCFNNTYYARAETLLDEVRNLCENVDPTFIAKCAVYARENGYMKDMPAFLTAVLASKDVSLMQRVFRRTLDNGVQIKKFAQVLRSGTVGRKSFGTAIKHAVQNWLDGRTDEQLFKDSIGGDVSMADLIKLTHPKPKNQARNSLYGYFLGKEYNKRYLPKIVKEYEKFKEGKIEEVPDVDFRFLTSLTLDADAWKAIARRAPWHMTRMNLNTFARHGVFDDKEIVNIVAKRLADKETIKRVKVFPYQLLAAFLAAQEGVPAKITEALQDAMELATENVPSLDCDVVVCPDVSGSMSSPITGDRGSATTKMRCIDVAALIASVLLRNNKTARVLPFENRVVDIHMNGRDSVMTNAQKLASIGGGGTACQAPLARLNTQHEKADLIVIVSDNESWVTSGYRSMFHTGTDLMAEWSKFKQYNKGAKMVLIDLQPGNTTQAPDKKDDILNVGGWNDACFTVMNDFLHGNIEANTLVKAVEAVEI